MRLPPFRYALLAMLSGCLWGAIGFTLAGHGFGPPILGGVVAAPFIGLVVAFVFRGFRERSAGARIALALVSLYLGTGLFALAVGLTDAARPIANRHEGAVVIQAVMAVWWGVSFTIYLPFLWALAYFTHMILGFADDGGGAAGARSARKSAAAAPHGAPGLLQQMGQRIRTPQAGDRSLLRKVAIAAAGVVGVLLLFRVLHEFRHPLGDLAVLVVGAGFLIYGGRAAWGWWKSRQQEAAPVGVAGALGVAGSGWMLVAIVHALSKVSSENYGMILVWPFVFLAAGVLIVAGAIAAAVGAMSAFAAVTKQPAKGVLIALAGGTAAILNLAHVVTLTRLVFTG